MDIIQYEPREFSLTFQFKIGALCVIKECSFICYQCEEASCGLKQVFLNVHHHLFLCFFFLTFNNISRLLLPPDLKPTDEAN